MDPLLSTLFLILLALLGSRFSFSGDSVSPGPRLLFRTGTHFVFLGFLLGPQVLGFVTTDALAQLDPLIALALGWVGFLFGLQLDREDLARFSGGFYAVALAQAVLAFGIFLALGWGVLRVAGHGGEVQVLLLLAAAATACITTPAGIALVSTNFLVRGRIRELLFFVASLDAVVGITALQIVYASYHPGRLVFGLASVPPIGWAVMAAGLGIVCAILFLWLTRPRPDSEELVLFLLGISALASGAALQLQVSPLFVCVVMGAVVANLHPDRQRVFSVLEQWEKPIYLVLLLLAGSLLSFPTLWILPLAALYVGLRVVAKVGSSAAVVRTVSLPFDIPKRFGLGLLPQGGISLAMAVSVVLTYQGLEVEGYPAVEIFFGVVVLGVVVSELVGPFFTTHVLRRAGEISPGVEEALEHGDERKAKEEAIRHPAPSASDDGGEEEPG